jgi:hypothetical protein
MCPDEPDIKHGITFALSFLHSFCTHRELLPIIIYRFDSYVEPVHAISYRATGTGEIDLVPPLRQELKEHNRKKASNFKAYHNSMTFGDHRSCHCKPDEYGQLQPDLAAGTMTEKDEDVLRLSGIIGKNGEAESLSVDAAHRSKGNQYPQYGLKARLDG